MYRFITFLAALVFTISATAGAPDSETIVVFKTSQGEIKVKLYDATPQHRDNFIKQVQAGTYDHTFFHRAIKGMNVQAGDVSTHNNGNGPALNKHAGDPLSSEFNPALYNKTGAIGMMHAPDRAGANWLSSGSQFYIVTGQQYTVEQLMTFERRRNIGNPNQDFKFSDAQVETYTTVGGLPQYDQNYTVFGEVIEGLDLVVSMSETPIDGKYLPTTPIEILSVEIR